LFLKRRQTRIPPTIRAKKTKETNQFRLAFVVNYVFNFFFLLPEIKRYSNQTYQVNWNANPTVGGSPPDAENPRIMTTV
jgi:hypothetical protein